MSNLLVNALKSTCVIHVSYKEELLMVDAYAHTIAPRLVLNWIVLVACVVFLCISIS